MGMNQKLHGRENRPPPPPCPPHLSAAELEARAKDFRTFVNCTEAAKPADDNFIPGLIFGGIVGGIIGGRVQ